MSESSDSGKPSETRGEVLDVLRELLTGRRDDDVVALVTQLVANNTELALRAAKLSQLEKRNAELEKQLERVLARYKKSEAVRTAQLSSIDAHVARRGSRRDDQRRRSSLPGVAGETTEVHGDPATRRQLTRTAANQRTDPFRACSRRPAVSAQRQASSVATFARRS